MTPSSMELTRRRSKMRSEIEVRKKLREVVQMLMEAERKHLIIEADYYGAVKNALEWVLGLRREI